MEPVAASPLVPSRSGPQAYGTDGQPAPWFPAGQDPRHMEPVAASPLVPSRSGPQAYATGKLPAPWCPAGQDPQAYATGKLPAPWCRAGQDAQAYGTDGQPAPWFRAGQDPQAYGIDGLPAPWCPAGQLILQGRTACERVQLEYLRGLLGVRDSTPALIVLAETGQLPLPAYWTLQVARFVSNLQAMGGERVARLAMLDSVALAADTDTGLPLARQPWAAQVSRVLAAAGAPCDLTADEGVAIPELAEALLERHVASYTHASVKVQRYIEDVWGGSISAEAYTPASFLCDVPERRRRVRLAQWRTRSHWMAEETGRWQRLDRTQRPCPHCQAPLEDVRHAVYDCPLYAGLREEYAELFHSPGHALPSLAAFLGQARQGRLARFADRCHEEHAAALAQ